jgi:hypothetical protein
MRPATGTTGQRRRAAADAVDAIGTDHVRVLPAIPELVFNPDRSCS